MRAPTSEERVGTKIRAAALTSLALAALAGCADLETVSPASTTTTTTTTSSAPTTDPPDPQIPKRTVLLRNPVGEPAQNLLADGDFELSTAYGGGGQYGFRMFSSTGGSELALLVETGGLCRSGLTCVKVRKGQILFGRGTAAASGKGHVLSLYAKMPAETQCSKISPLAVECDTFDVLAKADADEDFSADWCHYRTTFPPSKSAVCLYIQNQLQPDQVALVDAAVLGPNDGTIPFKASAPVTVDAATKAEMARVRDNLRRTMPFGKKPASGPALPQN